MSSKQSHYKVLVVGSGSIGRRHLRNLITLGIRELAICDSQEERLAPVVDELKIPGFTSYEKALAESAPDIVFVCTPPVFHLAQARQALLAGAHVFVEKPLSNTLEGVDDLIAEADSGNRVVRVGYNLRFHPGLLQIKQLLADGVIGRIFWAYIEFGQFLPDWRPWQDYRESYTARKDLGGGIIMDASHELDYAMWLLGTPSEVGCMAGKTSDLEMDVEDSATILLRFAGGTEAVIHVDCIQRTYSRFCKLVGELGTALWDYNDNQVRIFSSSNKKWENISYEFEPNQMYLREVEDFLAKVVKGKTEVTHLRHSRSVLAVALAARESAIDRKWVKLKH